MSRSEGEPAVKNPRLSRSRTLELELDELPPWAETATDEKLIKIFKIGTMVYDSISMHVNFKEEQIAGVIKTKLDSMVEKVNDLTEQAFAGIDKMQQRANENFKTFQDKTSFSLTKIDNHVEEFKNGLERQIDQVETQQSKQTQDIQNAVGRTEDALSNCIKRLEQLSTSHNNEKYEHDQMTKILLSMAVNEAEVFECHRITRSSKGETSLEKGKYLVQSSTNKQAPEHLMEITTGNKSCAETEQFEKYVKEKGFKVGILISTQSGIAKRVTGKRFEVMFMNGQYFIYLPNASRDQHLILWAIYMADELVALNQDLGPEQQQQVAELYKHFEKDFDTYESCAKNLALVKKTADELEKNLVPVSRIIEQAKEQLKIALGTNNAGQPA